MLPSKSCLGVRRSVDARGDILGEVFRNMQAADVTHVADTVSRVQGHSFRVGDGIPRQLADCRHEPPDSNKGHRYFPIYPRLAMRSTVELYMDKKTNETLIAS